MEKDNLKEQELEQELSMMLQWLMPWKEILEQTTISYSMESS